ncbi:WPP domain-interacting protein 1 [Linum grandiflorum]
MDLLDKSATALDFVVEGDLATSVTSSRSPPSDGNGKLEANGSCLDAISGFETGGNVVSITPLGSKQVVGLSNSNSSPAAGSSSPAIKGKGLKKWRRIRRDVVKDTSGVADSSKAVKRGLSGAGGSVRSVNRGSVENDREASEVFVSLNFGYENGVPGSSSDSRFAVGSAFTTGADSENSVSEDRSSKSSTAASAPRARNDLGGYGVENQRIKSYPVKVAGTSVQRSQQGKGHVESSKKARGERARIEKQSSQSSMESDSRSSNFVFSQGFYSATSNGKQREMSMNDDGENSVEAHGCEEQDIEELQTRYDHETVDEVGDHSHDDSAVHASSQNKGEKDESNDSSTEKDPLVESLIMLQSVQEALESGTLRIHSKDTFYHII